MTESVHIGAVALVWLSSFGCAPRPPTAVRGIELEDPQEEARRKAAETKAAEAKTAEAKAAEASTARSEGALVAAGTREPAAPSEDDDRGFVYSREPMAEQARRVAEFPIHINESWWAFRARHLGITVAQAQKRDAQLSEMRAPAGFWDAQTSVEAVSVWTVLCNECHGGRRSREDALEMPKPSPEWGEGDGLFFGKRGAYRLMFNVVKNGGPVKESGRAEMPAWRNILPTEMMWALLYFLEYQSGGIESRFAPSLYPRRPEILGKP